MVLYYESEASIKHIGRREMVEVVYRKESKDELVNDGGFKLPKNIRQIGGGKPDIQVYVEDNAYIYLGKYPDEDSLIRYGVLLGNVKRSCGYTYIFIYGVVDVREIFDNTVIFSDDIWRDLNNDISRFYPGQKVVGWFLSEYIENTGSNMWLKKMHLNNFGGNDKVFFRVNREEGEDGFYYYGEGKFDKLSCYHIFYEKNKMMTDYIVDGGMNEKLKSISKHHIVEKVISDAKIEVKEKEEKKTKFSQVAFWVPVAAAVLLMVGNFDAKAFKNFLSQIVGNEYNGGNAIAVNGIADIETYTDKETESETFMKEQVTSEVETEDDETTTVAVGTEPLNTKYYMVEKGDTLYSICRKLYGDTSNMKVIMELNDIPGENDIYYGKKLIVPR